MSWTEERIQELGRLWEAGHSASDIGKHLGVSKNAVVGKAHRLRLPSRPSPIKAAAQTQEAPARSRSGRPSRQREASQSEPAQPPQARHATGNAPSKPVDQSSRQLKRQSRGGAGAVNASPARRATPVKAKVEPRTSGPGCLWPIGDPGDTDFHFCGAASLPGKPYCAEHAARAYITRSRDRDEEAA